MQSKDIKPKSCKPDPIQNQICKTKYWLQCDLRTDTNVNPRKNNLF